ncbi:hypothetical protein Q8F55_002384 [Vanrija albida]|uniref:ABC transporter domain-containing protein n=1 Tax=Vanrija albida TaxID=181172 RepID=A0ABR3Q9L9_9TREE
MAADTHAAIPTTASLLAEIETGRASEITLALRYNTSPPGPTFVPELDEILLQARPHPGGSSLQRGDLVEVVGPSGAGKSTLAAFLLMTWVLPRSFALVPAPGGEAVEVPLGGRGAHAVLLSPASHPPLVPRIEAALRSHIETRVAATLAETQPRDLRAPLISGAIDELVGTSLERLAVLQPRPRALGWTLALRRAALDAPGLVVCDGFSDAFWPERWEDEKGERRRGARVRGSQDATTKDAYEAVTALRRDAGAVVVLTAQGVRPIPNTPFFKAQLPAPYPSPFAPRGTDPDPPTAWPLNIQLTLLGPSRPLQFPAETTLVDALRSRGQPTVQVLDAMVRVVGGKGLAGTLAGAKWSFGVASHGLVPFTHEK